MIIKNLISFGMVAAISMAAIAQPSAVVPLFNEVPGYGVSQKLAQYKKVKLTADLSSLSQTEKDALYFLIEAAKGVDPIFWMQTYGKDYTKFFNNCESKDLEDFIRLNYGPYDRLNNDAPFVANIGPKPLGANYYDENIDLSKYAQMPEDMQKDQYGSVRANQEGELESIPYFMEYQAELNGISNNLVQAMIRMQSIDMDFSQFIEKRINALNQGGYDESDIAWLGLKNSKLDIIIGPIESYDDKLKGIRTSFESYVLVRDLTWSKKLSKYLGELPNLQKNLPVDSAYKTETPGGDGDQLAVFDAVYYAGDCNSGSKTIAVNLPNSEELQKNVGTRRTQIRNVMKAKFDEIVLPISAFIIAPEQQKHIKFDAFFNNVMFHEVAHGLGIKNLVGQSGTVKDALGPLHNTIEECKADVLGLWMVTQMVDKKELPGDLADYYVTFVSSIFRSVRFGAGSAHGKANMIVYNTLEEEGAIVRDKNGKYKVDIIKMRKSIANLAGRLLKLQGDGNSQTVSEYITKYAAIANNLKTDIDQINNQNIPVDIRFEQGQNVLGLSKPGPFVPSPPKPRK